MTLKKKKRIGEILGEVLLVLSILFIDIIICSFF